LKGNKPDIDRYLKNGQGYATIRNRRVGSGTIGGQEVAEAIAAAVGCAKRRIVVVVVHLLRRLV
jgi:hypothetical protein